jgi:two-component system phosphate regulon sensor histidine kinase PhoR
MPEEKSEAAMHGAQLGHDRLISLINSMSDGVIAVDKSLKIVLYNGAALNILDLNSAMHGQRLDKVMEIIDANNQPVNFSDYVKEQKTASENENFRITYQDGSNANLYISVSPVHVTGKSGRAGSGGFVIVLRDITRQKSLEEERNEFISVVSHELRTPIAITEGNISNAQFVASHDNAGDNVKKALDEAHRQILFLAEMINDLATLSRAERNKLTLEIEPINVEELMDNLVKTYTHDAEAKNLTLRFKPGKKLGTLSSSQLYVREILQNFITNSLKYTEEGGITLSAAPKTGGVEFIVKDTGIGLSKTDREKVFDKFFRSEDFRTRKSSGTGLGLYITFKLTHLLHAELNVESKLNHGSTFTIFVPNLEQAKTVQPPDQTTQKASE